MVIEKEIQSLDTKNKNKEAMLKKLSTEDCVDIMYDTTKWKKLKGNSHKWVCTLEKIQCNSKIVEEEYDI